MRDSGTGTVGRKVKAILFVGVIVALLVVLVVAWLGKENPQAITAIEDLVHRYGLTGVFASTVIAGSIVPFGSPIIVACAAGFGLDIPVLV
jgi:Na+/proline symporter